MILAKAAVALEPTITTKPPPMTTDEQQRSASAGVIAGTDVGVNGAFDVFGSELPDEAFEGVFDQPRQMYKPVDLLFRGS
ncbi:MULTISPECIES: hypothetical protein [Bradyrhizobium]|uniref:hypothetical protein n=1 Tax=Bradyrhizobium TaxID=374 RepID=UPI000BA1A2F6|nr:MULTISPECIES: hypothetical protein [Bradyrhizobium]AWM07191.1 hypothetical protein CIT39_12510 [Bradyrhizobium symbiodeficiens]UPJ55696.1 hypothetical protein IVB24_23910 [Bradyrhizobium sp. 192]